MTPEISDFIPVLLVETDKYIEFADGNFFTAKQTGVVPIKSHDNNGKPFISTLYNVLLAPELCDQIFSITTLINSGYTYLFHKGFCTIFFSDNEQNAVTLPHIAKRKHAFLVKTKEKSKSQKKFPKKKVSLKLLCQRLRHIFTRSLLVRYAVNVWQGIEIRVDPDPFITSCQIYTIDKRLDQRHI